MSDVKVTVGGAIEDEAARRFVDAWHRVEQGEPVEARHVAFESWDALAKSLGRDYSNVHADVQALTSAGLLDVVDGQLRAEYDAINTTIAI